MANFKKRFKDWMSIEDEGELGNDDNYLEIESIKPKANYIIRPFVLNEFEDIRPVLKYLRTGKYIALVDLKPLKENDVIDLRRAINKLKTVNVEIAGDIAGLSGDWVVVTPHPIKIEKSKPAKAPVPGEFDDDNDEF
jgi:SepF-like predicted cell division protein (DUF552 family)